MRKELTHGWHTAAVLTRITQGFVPGRVWAKIVSPTVLAGTRASGLLHHHCPASASEALSHRKVMLQAWKHALRKGAHRWVCAALRVGGKHRDRFLMRHNLHLPVSRIESGATQRS